MFCLKIGAHIISRMLIQNTDLDFWNFDPKLYFGANLVPKIQRCPFCLKIGTHCISSILIFIQTLVFWISKPKSILGEIWAEKLRVVQFGWKLAHRVSRRSWFLIQHYFSQSLTRNPFLDKSGPRNSKLFILTENWQTWYIEDADSYSNNSFLNFQV